MVEYDNYKEIVKYFVLNSNPLKKTIYSFCEYTGLKNERGVDFVYDPKLIAKICDILVENNIMSCLRYDKSLGGNSVYCYIRRDEAISLDSHYCSLYLNSLVYGFKYIYDFYSEVTIPLVNVNYNDVQQIGTAFIIDNFIVTAKHCLENAKEIEIFGFNKEDLNKSKIYISENKDIDIAIINVDTSKYRTGLYRRWKCTRRYSCDGLSSFSGI